jgi:hypothetical protein
LTPQLVNDVTWFNLWTYAIESETIRNVWLCPFGSLAKNPLANIGWAVNQCDTPVLALTQESNNFNVHKSDFTQVYEYADVLIVHLSLYVADIGRLNSTTELQDSGVSVRLIFNPQHWQPLFINSSSVAGFENQRSCGIRVCMTSAIRKYLKQNGSPRFSVVHFRQMTRSQPIACLAEPGTGCG